MLRHPHTALLLVLSLAPGLRLSAQSPAPSPLTLRKALQLALAHSPALHQAHNQERAAAAGVTISRAGFLPSLTASEELQRGNDPVYVFGGLLRQHRFGTQDFQIGPLNRPAPLTDFSSALEADLTLWTGGGRRHALDAAHISQLLAELRREQTRQQVLLSTVQAYAALQASRENVRVARHAWTAAQAVLSDSTSRFRAGLTVSSDLQRAQVFERRAHQRLLAAQDAVTQGATLLNLRLGLPWNAAVPDLQPLATPNRGLPSLESWLQAQSSGFAVRSAALQRRLANTQRNGARSRLWAPRISGFARLQRDQPELLNGGGSNWMAGLSLRWNLFRGGADAARLRQAASRLAAARDAQTAAREEQLADITGLWRQARLAQEQWLVDTANRRRALSAASTIAERFRAGLASLTQRLQAESVVVQAQAELVRATYDFQVARARLNLATAQLHLRQAEAAVSASGAPPSASAQTPSSRSSQGVHP